MAEPDTRPSAPEENSAPSEAVVLPEPARDDADALPKPDEAAILRDLPPEDAFPADPVAEPPTGPIAPPRAAEPPAPRAEPRRSSGGLVGGLIGGVLAAGLGYGVAQYMPDGWPIGADATLEPQLAAQGAEIAALRSDLDTLTARPSAAGADQITALQTALDEATAKADGASAALSAQEARLADLETRLAALENRPGGDGGVSPAALQAYESDLAALKAELDAQKGAGAALVGEVQAAADAAQTRLAEAEAQAAALKAEAEATARTATLTAALARVQAALDSGAPFAAPLADLTAAGVAVPEPLSAAAEAGLPTRAALEAAFPEAARAALEASLRADMGEGWTERLGSFLRSQTGARSLAPREGTDPDAVLSRAEAALRDGDLPRALTELGGLPPEGQAAMADWVAQAQARIQATEAVAALAAAL